MQALSNRQAAAAEASTSAPQWSLRRSGVRVARRSSVTCAASSDKEVTLLDYGAGNVRSVRNAIKKLGYSIRDVSRWPPRLTPFQRCVAQ